MPGGVIGNTFGSGPKDSRFEPWPGSTLKCTSGCRITVVRTLGVGIVGVQFPAARNNSNKTPF